MDFHLPEDYMYKIVKHEINGESIFRIQGITDKSEALIWLKKFSNLSKTAWRVARTYPKSGRKNVFKIDMRCVHSTDNRVLGVRPSKITGCSSTLQVLIKRFKGNIRSEEDEMDRDWSTIITIRGAHNHPLGNSDFLEYQDISEDSLRENANVLEYQDVSENSLLENADVSEKQVNSEKSLLSTGALEYKSVSVNPLVALPKNIPSFPAERIEEFNNLINRIMNGIKNAPEMYVPAAKKMLENAKKFASTEMGLINAMNTFGTCNEGLIYNCDKKVVKKSYALTTDVPLTAAGRTKNYLPAKRKLYTGSEKEVANVIAELKCHDYTKNFSLPRRKRKVQHNLSKSAYKDNGLNKK